MRLTEDNIGDYAETWVKMAQAKGTELDYSEDSIAVLEDLLRASDPLLQTPEFPDDQRNLLVFYHGCYLGEVMARHLNGVWNFDPQNWADSTMVFTYGPGGIQIFPFLKLWLRVTEGPTDNDLVTYYEGLKERLGESGSGVQRAPRGPG